MKFDSVLFWIKNFVGNIVFSICEIAKDVKTIMHNKKRKSPPPITKVISSIDNDEIFRGFEVEIEEEWLERGVVKKW